MSKLTFLNNKNNLFKIYSAINMPTKITDKLTKNYKLNISFETNTGIKIEKEKFMSKVKNCDGIICTSLNQINKEILDAAGKKLKIISTFSVGYDHIDVKECISRNIKVCNCTYGEYATVAEFTIGFLLNISRKITESIRAYPPKNQIDSLYWYSGSAIQNSTIGIFGLGNIGLSIAKRLTSFQPNRIIYNNRKINLEANKFGFQYVSFDELLEKSDFILCTCALNKETELIFNKNAFKKMKSNAIFINVSRGMVVNQDDLYDALIEKNISAAGLDVTVPIFLPNNHKLLTLNNCFITPYIAWSARNSTDERLSVVIDNIVRFIEGAPLPNEVTL